MRRLREGYECKLCETYVDVELHVEGGHPGMSGFQFVSESPDLEEIAQ